jgi:hypothetical protein
MLELFGLAVDLLFFLLSELLVLDFFELMNF